MVNAIIDDYISGAISGAAGLIVGHPFDTTKVHLQTSNGTFRGTLHAAASVNSQGLIRGFYRGLGFPLVSYGLVNSVLFGVYGSSLGLLVGDGQQTYGKVAVAGIVSGFAQLIVACPVDRVKVILQSQIPKQGSSSTAYFSGPRQCLQHIYTSGGLRSCYRGFLIQGVRDLPANATYFVTYEVINDFMTSRQLTDRKGVFASLTAGGLAGVLSWIIIMPFDVIKSHIQADVSGTGQKTVLSCARQIYARRGIQGFFTGALVVSIRAFPVNAVIFATHRHIMSVLHEARTT